MQADRYKQYIAIKYTSNGRVYPYLDCWGLVCYFYHTEFNIDLQSMDGYIRSNMTDGYNIVKSDFTEIELPKFGDVVAFFRGGILTHVGVMIDGYRFLHTGARYNTSITDVKNRSLVENSKLYTKKFYRYVGGKK